MVDELPRTVYWLDNTLYLNITNQCSNSCYFCLKRYRRGVGGFNLKLTHEPTVEEITLSLPRFCICEVGMDWFSAVLASQRSGWMFCLRLHGG